VSVGLTGWPRPGPRHTGPLGPTWNNENLCISLLGMQTYNIDFKLGCKFLTHFKVNPPISHQKSNDLTPLMKCKKKLNTIYY
jgi:hypothetical protein